jgi:hypothetical protein
MILGTVIGQVMCRIHGVGNSRGRAAALQPSENLPDEATLRSLTAPAFSGIGAGIALRSGTGRFRRLQFQLFTYGTIHIHVALLEK